MVFSATYLEMLQDERNGRIDKVREEPLPVNLREDSTAPSLGVLTDNNIARVERAVQRSNLDTVFGKIALKLRQCIEDARGRREADLSFDVGAGHRTSDLSGNSDSSL